MPANTYHLVSQWIIEATVEEVSDVISDIDALLDWWPSVYLQANVLQPGGEKGVGKIVDLTTKGWLPYTIHWQLQVSESREPYGFSFVASGGFSGRGAWTFTQDRGTVVVDFDWQIDADKPLLRYGSLVLKPIFAANHRWAMARGEESLRLELLRRRATTKAERDSFPAPPGPTFRRPSAATPFSYSPTVPSRKP